MSDSATSDTYLKIASRLLNFYPSIRIAGHIASNPDTGKKHSRSRQKRSRKNLFQAKENE